LELNFDGSDTYLKASVLLHVIHSVSHDKVQNKVEWKRVKM